MSGAHREGRSRAPRRKRLSAGILLYRQVPAGTEVLLAHPGGPWFARRDAGAWTIPKGEPDAGDPDDGDDDERLLAVALREFAEETGQTPEAARPIDLGAVVQKGGKVVRAWALRGELDPATASSNTVDLEWPPGSGRHATFPEVDRVAWFALAEARRRILAAQAPLLDRLADALGEAR